MAIALQHSGVVAPLSGRMSSTPSRDILRQWGHGRGPALVGKSRPNLPPFSSLVDTSLDIPSPLLTFSVGIRDFPPSPGGHETYLCTVHNSLPTTPSRKSHQCCSLARLMALL